MNTLALYTGLDEISSDKSETRLESLQAVLHERAEHERELVSRHPMVPVFVNWAIVFMLVALTVSLIIWGIDSTIRYRASQMTAQAMEERDQQQAAEQQAEAERLAAEAQSEAALMELEAQDCAKALYGIHLFDEKYNYDEKDFLTYLRSAFNRVDAMGDPVRKDGEDDAEYRQRKLEYRQKKLHDVLFNGQYLASYETNTVQTKYLNIARKAVKEWHEETSKPCDLDYQFAELNSDGVWLVKDINADGYARRWRYG